MAFGKRNNVSALEKSTPPPPAQNSDSGKKNPPDPMKTPARAQEPSAIGSDRAGATSSAGEQLHKAIFDRIDFETISRLDPEQLRRELRSIASQAAVAERIVVSEADQERAVGNVVDDMTGLGPLQRLIDDPAITDILVNGIHQVYCEHNGKLKLFDVAFRDVEHLANIAQRIAVMAGRRVDESNPLVDARLEDGSRVHIAFRPTALDGPYISIRKFSKFSITLDMMARQNNISQQMCDFLKIASACRLNVIVSGGTGAGKTTLLNALSQLISPGERILTIEDTAELKLQQPHVVRLESRPANLEGKGEITIFELVRNALRMRPDRIVVGEVRGAEVFDMLQAMNTGHDGSLATLHANTPRECLKRIENMVAQSGLTVPTAVVREQISAALDMVIQIARMRDGKRRVTSITEVGGMEGDVVISQELFRYRYQGTDADDNLIGDFEYTGLNPTCSERVNFFNMKDQLDAVLGERKENAQ